MDNQAAAAADSVSKVLGDEPGNDDLLIEVLLRVGFPTTLICAALVCKRWYRQASDRKFLCRFRKLYPPCVLGFYPVEEKASRFVPMLPQPPELAAVIRRLASYSLGTDAEPEHGYLGALFRIVDCRNGSIFTECNRGRGMVPEIHRPLCPDRGIVEVPVFPHHHFQQGNFYTASQILSKEEGDGSSYLYVLLESTCTIINPVYTVNVYVLQDGVWCMHTSATTQLPYPPSELKAVLVDNKIYMAVTMRSIIVLDLMTSSVSKIQLPQELQDDSSRDMMLSRPDDASGVYLVHANRELQLNIWLHKGENWLLEDTFSLREMVANMRMSDHTLKDEHNDFLHVTSIGLAPKRITQVGDNAEFVFLHTCGCTLYLDVKSRTLRKVYPNGRDVYPLMTIWPPTFPALKADGCSLQEMPCEEGY